MAQQKLATRIESLSATLQCEEEVPEEPRVATPPRSTRKTTAKPSASQAPTGAAANLLLPECFVPGPGACSQRPSKMPVAPKLDDSVRATPVSQAPSARGGCGYPGPIPGRPLVAPGAPGRGRLGAPTPCPTPVTGMGPGTRPRDPRPQVLQPNRRPQVVPESAPAGFNRRREVLQRAQQQASAQTLPPTLPREANMLHLTLFLASHKKGGSQACTPQSNSCKTLDLDQLCATLQNPTSPAAVMEPASPCLSNATCGVCYGPISVNKLEVWNCGKHHCCRDCAVRWCKAELQRERFPLCIDEKCDAELDPLVARRIMNEEMFEQYMEMSIWKNPAVESCPKCGEVLFADFQTISTGMGQCPACQHAFCKDCRCPVHLEFDCLEARRRYREQMNKEYGLNEEGQQPARIAQQEVLAETATGGATARESDEEIIDGLINLNEPRNHNGNPAEQDEVTESKPCPRCGVTIEKIIDDRSCDHVTCRRCRHEFCWQCFADRFVIYAHGNHFHWPDCPFYAPYDGPDRHDPKNCYRCRQSGVVCKQPAHKGRKSQQPVTLVGQYTSLVDACVRWVTDILQRGNCALQR